MLSACRDSNMRPLNITQGRPLSMYLNISITPLLTYLNACIFMLMSTSLLSYYLTRARKSSKCAPL